MSRGWQAASKSKSTTKRQGRVCSRLCIETLRCRPYIPAPPRFSPPVKLSFTPATSLLLFVLQFFFALPLPTRADPAVPPNILDPKTAAEAWNIIRLARANAARLIAESRFDEMTVQMSFFSPSLRRLVKDVNKAEAVAPVQELITRAQPWVVAVARTSGQNNPTGTIEGFEKLTGLLDQLATWFDPKIVASEIYVCPVHPEIAEPVATAPCSKCGRALVPRRLPYSFIYMPPGEPTVKLTATPDGPMIAGKKVTVKIRLARNDRSPVVPDDLLLVHTQPIHLLIQDPSLSDYHHELPSATATPGEYEFSFTPQKSAPYRVWADLVPALTGVEELPFVDLPSSGKGEPFSRAGDTFTSSVDDLHFELNFAGGNFQPPKAGQVHAMVIKVTAADGKPVTQLEPTMNAFAHLVGFYDDYHTIIHLHPAGGEILDARARGGPLLDFRFYPPKPGSFRLYGQIVLGGKMITVPFNLTVAP